MSFDPQQAPLTWQDRIGPVMTDIDGADIVLVQDQDGEQYVIDLDERP